MSTPRRHEGKAHLRHVQLWVRYVAVLNDGKCWDFRPWEFSTFESLKSQDKNSGRSQDRGGSHVYRKSLVQVQDMFFVEIPEKGGGGKKISVRDIETTA